LSSAPASKLRNRTSVLAPEAILQNRYRIVRRLGEGGMGAVYEAIDLRLDAVVALKETFSVDDALRRQFEQEARLLAQLHHAALPRVSDYFTEGDRAFLVMQFIGGVDLAEIIVTQPGPFPRSQVIAWADQLLDALMYLHTRDRQIIHRDIKPHNLKVTANGQIALLDFGLAKAQTADASGSNSSTSIFGYTRRYSPLEQIQDQGTTPQSDIYALGATLYHLLTGVKPQDALARAAAMANSKADPLRPADEVHSAVGPEIAAILTRAMALSQEDRYLTASDFREALRGVGRSETALVKNSARRISRPAGDSTLNPTVVRKASTSSFDPFDSYSILKPAELAWVVPKQSRQPGIIAGALAVVLMISVGAFYSFGHWIDSKTPLVDYAKANSGKNDNGAVAAHQSKAEKPRVNAAGPVTAPTAFTSESGRKSEKQKHPARRADSAHSKIPSRTPPPFSISP
jgi:eukaryotic-like serine/threonine-protein kinase